MDQLTQRSIDLLKGPSGRAIAHPMDEAILEAFSEHITIERLASAQYFAQALWFAERELRGFSKFFEHESKDEQEHASNFSKYLIARGQSVSLDKLPAPKLNFASALDVVTESFQMEADVTTSVQQLYSLAERANDTRTNVFLDPVIEDQIKSEDEFAYLIGKIKLAADNPSALFIIDKELLDR